ncbi:alpha/beta hydrolase [Muricauda oceani]|uniref:Alpha/beta hydrolase n=1 Tax=Flagellimonas oceani TaxID=2698672 RepID=A0A6G7J2W0_9FLAO|nr:alpha/beta hydrolase [Allomuricauda oceani]MBW8244135.1 alpha/beta hydrolase [Allomuricauda oceani]QII45106.1 alpha/beta hydrolase [Allomuricauda oceani]
MRFIFFVLFYSFMLSGQAQDYIVPLWEDEVPNAKVSTLEEQLKNPNARVISKVIDPSLEVYLPSSVINTGTMVMICPGGGYGALAYDKEGTDIAKWLNGQGIAAAVLKYRLPEDESNQVPHLTPLMDAKQGIEILRSMAGQWGVDPSKVGVMGFSAGGHLASTLGTHFEEANRPDFMILIYPVVTMKKDYTHNGSRNNLLGNEPSKELVDLYSNELQVKPNTPTTFILHCEDDLVVPVENSIQFYGALKKEGVKVEMHLYPDGGHGFAMGFQHGRLATWRSLLLEWLKAI